MNEETPHIKEVDEFILEQIDTVPHLEALLLLWNSQPRQWSVEEMASALYVSSGVARNILQTLARRGLLVGGRGVPEWYRYESGKRDSLIQAVEATYRRDLIRISRMIHSKAAPGIREFAQAFRFTKDRE
jgi:predicted ArsR family transcriptional regulator